MLTRDAIIKKQAVVGIIGLGYVGLPLAAEFASCGFPTIGFDIDAKKITKLQRRESYFKHIPNERIAAMIGAGFTATADYTRLCDCDAVILCVPTPLSKNREPDLSYVTKSTEIVRAHLAHKQLVVLESTTYPKTTREVILPILSGNDRTVGEDFYLAFSPEREDPNNKYFTTATIPKVVGGITATCLDLAKLLYDQIVVKTVPVSSTDTAEAVKILENTFRSINIALVNELKMVFSAMGIDIWEVIEAASTKPFGYTPFYPGPGLGGHCIPIDPFYLSWKAREYDIPTKFIELAGEINTFMPHYVVKKVIEYLSGSKLSVNGAKILILGVAYKKDVDDMRESPAMKIIELLEGLNAIVDYYDPNVPFLPQTRHYKLDKRSIAWSVERLKTYDLALITTDHSDVDYTTIADNVQILVDTRNATRDIRAKRSNIFLA